MIFRENSNSRHNIENLAGPISREIFSFIFQGQNVIRIHLQTVGTPFLKIHPEELSILSLLFQIKEVFYTKIYDVPMKFASKLFHGGQVHLCQKHV